MKQTSNNLTDQAIRQLLSNTELAEPANINISAIMMRIEKQKMVVAAKNKKRKMILIIALGIIAGILLVVGYVWGLKYYFPELSIGALTFPRPDFSIFYQVVKSPAIAIVIPFAVLLTIDGIIRKHKKAAGSKQ